MTSYTRFSHNFFTCPFQGPEYLCGIDCLSRGDAAAIGCFEKIPFADGL